ncbi:MAG TPA: TIGR03013 family XrtA/PEP-CTERM system glycosyltransferase [Vicinamibacterales bacterium]|jgi:sugar transferase (PEP-CTERM system associated)|nr:TIGR03013 family XrtA/PEP-CTERM system glycosyltransferase [Vicinamibacterales bacterium]
MIRFLVHRVRARSLALAGCETALMIIAVVIAAALRFGREGAADILLNDNGIFKVLLIVGIAQVSLYYADLYDLRIASDRRELYTRLIQALASTSFALALLYFWAPSLMVGRGVFLIAAVLVIIIVVGWRLSFEWLSGRVGPREKLLLVGTSPAAVGLARELYEHRHELGVEIAGFIDPDPAKVGTSLLNPGIVGTIDDIPRIVRANGVDRVVVSLGDARGTLPMDKLLEMKLEGVAFDHLASVYEEYTGKIAVENLRPSWLIFSDGFRKSRFLGTVKRAMDVACASLGLVLAAPLMVMAAVAIRLTSPGPLLYHQQRVGKNGHIFTVHKFRSMGVDAEATTGPVWASKDGDPRVTPVGAFLRRSRLDEVPQLWNVLKGDMSFVGPRPERPEFVEELTKEIRFYGQRHIVRPGLTGWAQVRYTYGATTEDALQKLQYDLYYIKNLSIALDLFIIFETVKTVILRKGA